MANSLNPMEALQLALRGDYMNGRFSDAIIRWNGVDFQVHKLVLSAQSELFSKAFAGNRDVENGSSVIELADEVDEGAIRAMLHFMYHFGYGDCPGADTMILNVQVYSLGEKYAIPALKEEAKKKFRAAASTDWEDEAFPLIVEAVYSSTPGSDRGLRDLTVEIVHANINSLLYDNHFCGVLRATPQFAADMVVYMSDRSPMQLGQAPVQAYKCPDCKTRIVADMSRAREYYCINCGNSRRNWSSCITNEKQDF